MAHTSWEVTISSFLTRERGEGDRRGSEVGAWEAVKGEVPVGTCLGKALQAVGKQLFLQSGSQPSVGA